MKKIVEIKHEAGECWDCPFLHTNDCGDSYCSIDCSDDREPGNDCPGPGKYRMTLERIKKPHPLSGIAACLNMATIFTEPLRNNLLKQLSHQRKVMEALWNVANIERQSSFKEEGWKWDKIHWATWIASNDLDEFIEKMREVEDE